MRWVRVGLVTCALLAAATALQAQGAGGLTVRVVDATGEPLPGASVTLSHDNGNVAPFTLLSDRNGTASFPVLRPGGGYNVEVEFSGFATRRHASIRVRGGEQTTIPIAMTAEIVERHTVEGSREIVELEETASSTKFSDEFVQDLPVPGRFYQNVLTLAPGVQDPDGDGNPTVHGSRSRDFRAEIGGVSNVDPLTGQFMSLINSDSIEEMEVVTGGAGVEFGRAQGGFARIVQKQGTNQFEGTFGMLFRTSALDGTGAADSNNLNKPSFREIHPSAQVSGPIIKDRLWYRLSHELLDQEIPINVVSSVEVRTVVRGIHADQLTWQISPRNKLAFQFQSDPLSVDNLGISSVTPPESTVALETGSRTYSATWTAPRSPKLLIETTVAWQDLNRRLLPTQRGVSNDCVVDSPLLQETICRNLYTGRASGSANVDRDTHSKRLTVRSQGTLHAGRLGIANHQFKFGFSAENERYDQSLEQRPDLVFFFSDPFFNPQPVLQARVAAPQSTDVRATGTNWSVYFEDQITPVNNLVLTVGLRVDREEITSNGRLPFSPEDESNEFLALAAEGVPAQNLFREVFTAYDGIDDFVIDVANSTGVNPGILLNQLSNVTRQSTFWQKRRVPGDIKNNNTNFAPRIGISWDPWSNGKTKFALSAGRYYDKLFLNIPLLELNPPTTNLTFDLSNDGDVLGFRDNVNPAVTIDSVSRGLETPYQDEWRFLFEREVFTETLLRVVYVNRDYRSQLQNQDINHLPGDFGACRVTTNLNPEPTVESPGAGDELTDIFTGETYIDTDPGIGDGRVDDCVGAKESGREAPDGLADLYTQNPGWGQINLVGNFNVADYEGAVLELIRRQYRGWEMQASYTYSKATGNGEDFNQFLGLDPSRLDDEFGFQSGDQRHVVKFLATTITPWGFRLGGTAIWQSGLPYSVLTQTQAFDTTPAVYGNLGSFSPARIRLQFPTGVRNDQRNPSYWLFDLKLTKEMNLGRGVNLQVSAEVFNLLNEGVYRVYNPDAETGSQVNGINDAQRLFGRRWQIGFKLAF